MNEIVKAEPDKTVVEITPFGSDEKIKLSVGIVQRLIAVKTKSGKIPDADQCMKFLMLCKARHLNPFEGDAYLLGYDTQSGPQFSLITAHQVFLKRAEASAGFDGMQSGVTVKDKDGAVWDRDGDLVFDEDTLIGGWAKVHRKDRMFPFYRRLKLSTFNTGQSRWAKDPAGMIVKCAEADALRSAFPTHLGGLYIPEEPQSIDVQSEVIQRPTFAPKSKPAPEETVVNNVAETTRKLDDANRKKKKPTKVEQDEAREASLHYINMNLVKGGFTEDDLMTVANKLKWTKEMALADVPTDTLDNWLKEWDEIQTQMQDYKAVTAGSVVAEEAKQDALFK